MEESNETPILTGEELEPDIITHNQSKIAHFRRVGFFLIYWKKTKYEASNRRMMLFYLLCYFGAAAMFALSYGIRAIYKEYYPNLYKDTIDDLLEFAFVGIFLGICPSCWNYLLREYNTYLPLVLSSAKKLEKTEVYQNLEFSKNPKISYQEGFQEVDHNDVDDEVNIETEKSIKEQWWIVKYGPFVGIILSVIVCTILVTANLIKKITEIFLDSSADTLNRREDTLKHLMKDLPSFCLCILYPIPCYVSTWFCIFFIEWQRKIYESLRKHIRNIKKSNFDTDKEICNKLTEESKQELENICYMLIKLQKVFILLNKKIFQKTVVISFTLFIFLDVFCTCMILQHPTNYVYLFPLLIINGHTYFLCKWSNDLMAEFSEIMEVLNEMHEDDVDNIRREFNECPPQVLGFGGFSVNYSMMTAVIAFALSIVSISGMIWPEFGNDENLQTYQNSFEKGNYTLCLKEYCYKYQNSDGGWNKTLCINDKEQCIEFINGKGTFDLELS